jgi:hypothetical protein
MRSPITACDAYWQAVREEGELPPVNRLVTMCFTLLWPPQVTGGLFSAAPCRVRR